MEIVTSWMKEGLRQGRQEGRLQGIQEGRREGLQEGKRQATQAAEIKAARDAVVEILEARFKKIPAGLKKTVRAIDDRRQLKRLLRHAATVVTLNDFERSVSASWPGRKGHV
jgi:flagellar biosynthesis/type III secretory pathway protein FliH